MNRPKQQKLTRKQLEENVESFRNLYTKAVYSIMEVRHAMGDTEAKWSHTELIEKIKSLVDNSPSS
tara:strand:- start:4855 stop:5052 length:198 start_codon:yes stop_codon:yes gene_type:complete